MIVVAAPLGITAEIDDVGNVSGSASSLVRVKRSIPRDVPPAEAVERERIVDILEFGELLDRYDLAVGLALDTSLRTTAAIRILLRFWRPHPVLHRSQ